MKEKNIYCKECNIYYRKKYYIIHKYTQMHMENDIKFKSDEDIYENIMNYLIIQL
jgi:hypothetical protein